MTDEIASESLRHENAGHEIPRHKSDGPQPVVMLDLNAESVNVNMQSHFCIIARDVSYSMKVKFMTVMDKSYEQDGLRLLNVKKP